MPIEKFVPIVVSAFVALYAGVTAQKWALTYIKTLDALYVLIALEEIFFTKSARKFWSKLKVKDNENKAVGMFLVRTHGFFSLEYRIQEYCLACGIEIPKAMAFGALAGLAYFLSISSLPTTSTTLQDFVQDTFTPFGLYYFRPSSLQCFLKSR